MAAKVLSSIAAVLVTVSATVLLCSCNCVAAADTLDPYTCDDEADTLYYSDRHTDSSVTGPIYKKAAEELYDILEKYEAIPFNRVVAGETASGETVYSYDFSQRLRFIDEHREDLLDIANRLNQVVAMSPSDGWTPDALLCLTMYLKFNLKGLQFTDYDTIAFDAMWRLQWGLNDYEAFDFNDWTVKTFGESVFDNYYVGRKVVYPANMSFDDWFGSQLTYYIAVEAIRKGGPNYSADLLRGLQQGDYGDDFAGLIDEQMMLIAQADYCAAGNGDLLYLDGGSLYIGWDDITKQPEFTKYDEIDGPASDDKIMVYSVRSPLSSGGCYAYFISVVKTTHGDRRVLFTRNVSKYVAGPQYDLCAPLDVKFALDCFKHNTYDAVHLSICRSSNEADTVSSNMSEVFFYLYPDYTNLLPFFELKDSGNYYSDGGGLTKLKTTELYVGEHFIYKRTFTSDTDANANKSEINFDQFADYYSFDCYDMLGKSFSCRSTGREGFSPGGMRKLKRAFEPLIAEMDLYQKLLYPDGLPAEKDENGDVTGQAEYEFVDSIRIPDSDIGMVLYSENLPPEYSDYMHSVYLAILKYDGASPRLIRKIDVTGYLPDLSGDGVGVFQSLEGVLNTFKLTNEDAVLHLSLGCTISGSGSITEASNVFYLVDKVNCDIVPILTSLDDSGYGRAGWCCNSYFQTYIYLADLNADGTMEILTQKYAYEINKREHRRNNLLSEDLVVYSYDAKDNKFKPVDTVHSLPGDAIELDRACAIGVHEDSEDDWEVGG